MGTYHVKAMKAAVSLVLTTASRLKSSSVDSEDAKKASDEVISNAVDHLYPFLEKWVKAKLSETSFGGSRIIFYEHSCKTELKVYAADLSTFALCSIP